jgi:putative membrane protein
MWGEHEGMGWWMLLGSVWFVLFWGAVIYFVFWAANRGGGGRSSTETPLDILKRRYASGEISKEEFDRMRHDLS